MFIPAQQSFVHSRCLISVYLITTLILALSSVFNEYIILTAPLACDAINSPTFHCCPPGGVRTWRGHCGGLSWWLGAHCWHWVHRGQAQKASSAPAEKHERPQTLFLIELNLLQTYSGKPLLRANCMPGTAMGILCILNHLIVLSFETITLHLPPFYRLEVK